MCSTWKWSKGVTRVPNAPAHVDGVVFSRGQVVPAVNLRARFGFERAAYDLRSRLIVVQSSGRHVGLIADDAREFVRISPTAIHAAAGRDRGDRQRLRVRHRVARWTACRHPGPRSTDRRFSEPLPTA
jgi:chemotaxis signal transduction protein